MRDKNFWINELGLEEHPEGGYYREVYRSKEMIKVRYEEAQIEKKRNLFTSIYFLLTKEKFSAFHRIKSDELWHFHEGDSILIHSIDPKGILQSRVLGKDLANGEQLQLVVSAGEWFASEVTEGGEYSLVGCTVAPGFDFSDFEIADSELKKQFSEHSELIDRLTIGNK
jgi:predicted cupin superfamily sugar epimerase